MATTTPTWCGCDVHQSLQKPHERPTSNADQGPGQEQAVLRRGFSVQKRPREPVFGRGKTQGSEVHLPLQAARVRQLRASNGNLEVAGNRRQRHAGRRPAWERGYRRDAEEHACRERHHTGQAVKDLGARDRDRRRTGRSEQKRLAKPLPEPADRKTNREQTQSDMSPINESTDSPACRPGCSQATACC